jgi:hypothetical protein
LDGGCQGTLVSFYNVPFQALKNIIHNIKTGGKVIHLMRSNLITTAARIKDYKTTGIVIYLN